MTTAMRETLSPHPPVTKPITIPAAGALLSSLIGDIGRYIVHVSIAGNVPGATTDRAAMFYSSEDGAANGVLVEAGSEMDVSSKQAHSLYVKSATGADIPAVAIIL